MHGADDVLGRKLLRAFAMLDTDGDGALVEADLLTLADRLAAAFAMTGDAAKIIRLKEAFRVLWDTDLLSMDADGNGLVDRQEFLDGMRKAAANDREGHLTRLGAMVDAWMDICDADGNGVIDRDEFLTMYTRTLGASPDALILAFKALDRDGNGTLDRDEIRLATEEYYTSNDPQAPGNWLFGPF
ncbi:EF-hand domain-containing protein [Streptomyces sp. NPDC059009]|uniref:EF-hand domain-containing protein n=1 Tax=Streptomyces sp. NPDC059009 TaxID=3346694 RepID=UPI00367F9821